MRIFFRGPRFSHMRLTEYLEARGETPAQLAGRAGLLRQTVEAIIYKGVRPRVDTAHCIVLASRAEPAPDGGTIRFEDLLPEASPR